MRPKSHAATTVEPPGDDATPEDLAQFLGSVLQATRADITSACLTQEAGEQRRMSVRRIALRLTAAQRDAIETRLTRLLDEAEHNDDDDQGTWTRVLITMVDLQDRS